MYRNLYRSTVRTLKRIYFKFRVRNLEGSRLGVLELRGSTDRNENLPLEVAFCRTAKLLETLPSTAIVSWEMTMIWPLKGSSLTVAVEFRYSRKKDCI